MPRRRNFSNWAYWRLNLERQANADPVPIDALATDFDPWRARTRDRLDAMLGASPRRVALDVETTESVDCGEYQRDRIVFDTEETMSVPAFVLVPHARREAA